MKTKIKSTIFYFFLVLTCVTKADFVVQNGNDIIQVVDECIYVDLTNKLTVAEAHKRSADFFLSTNITGYVKVINATYWLKFRIVNPKKQGLILYRHRQFSQFKLYELQKDGSFVEHNQFYQEFNLSTVFKQQQYVFELNNADSCTTFLIKLVPVSDQFIGLELKTTRDFFMNSANDIFYYGCFFGLLFLMILYNLIHFIFGKENVNLFYALFLCGMLFYASGVWYILPFNLLTKKYSFFLFTLAHSIMTVSLVLYTMYFFQFEKKHINLKKILIFLLFFKVGLLTVQLISNEPNVFVYSPIYDIFIILFCIYIGFVFLLKEKFTPSIFFLLGFGVIVFGFFIKGFYVIYSFFNLIFGWKTLEAEQQLFQSTDNFLFYMGVIQLFLFSISISYRYKIIKSEATQAQQQIIYQLKSKQELIDNQNKILEQTVLERTALVQNQADEISRINTLLEQQNSELKNDVKKISIERVMVNQISIEEFRAIYPTDSECLSFLADLKWKEGYKCIKCGKTAFSSTSITMARRCNHCKYIETPTANSIFHHLRFPVVKAFYIMFLLYTRKQITIDEISKTIDLRPATCHAFKQKVIESMNNKKKNRKMVNGWSDFILD